MKNFYYLKTDPYNFEGLPSSLFDVSHTAVKEYKHPFRQLTDIEIPPYFNSFFTDNHLLDKNEIIRANWFKLRPHSSGPIHLDGIQTLQDTWGLNWFINWKDTYMQWFKPKKEGVWYPTFNSRGGITWTEEEVELVESVELNNPCFVNIDGPHRMMSKSDDWRFCISVRIFKTVILEDIGKSVVRTIPKEEMFERLSAQNLIES
jgi:hypothetical protein